MGTVVGAVGVVGMGVGVAMWLMAEPSGAPNEDTALSHWSFDVRPGAAGVAYSGAFE